MVPYLQCSPCWPNITKSFAHAMVDPLKLPWKFRPDLISLRVLTEMPQVWRHDGPPWFWPWSVYVYKQFDRSPWTSVLIHLPFYLVSCLHPTPFQSIVPYNFIRLTVGSRPCPCRRGRCWTWWRSRRSRSWRRGRTWGGRPSWTPRRTSRRSRSSVLQKIIQFGIRIGYLNLSPKEITKWCLNGSWIANCTRYLIRVSPLTSKRGLSGSKWSSCSATKNSSPPRRNVPILNMVRDVIFQLW